MSNAKLKDLSRTIPATRDADVKGGSGVIAQRR